MVTYGSGKRVVSGTRAGSRMKKNNFKRRFLPHHSSQCRDIWFTDMHVFDPHFVHQSVLLETKGRRVEFRRSFGNIPLAEGNVLVPNVRSSGTKPKAPVTYYQNRDSCNHSPG